MNRTPLQTAIDEFYKDKDKSLFGSDSMISRTKIVTFLRSLLPQEEKFALDFFISGNGVGSLNEAHECTIDQERFFDDKYGKLTNGKEITWITRDTVPK